ncbi:MAG: ORF6N domain-containing protein, partial [Rhodocyclaceae bacterium]
RRNSERFPGDFMFALEQDEWEALRSQFATLKTGRGQHRKYLPYVFTEHGAIMAATVLNSPRAVEVSIFVVRAFVQLRELLAGHKELAKRLDELEARIERKLMTHDQAIAGILDAIRQLMAPPPTKKRPIGFVTGEKK